MAKRKSIKPEEEKLKRFEVDFGEGVVGAILHNLPEIYGASIECALPNYVFRTSKPTLKGFCDYMLSKQPERTAYPEETKR